MRTEADLQHILQRIDGRGYKAYLDLKGRYLFEPPHPALGPAHVSIDHVQGDPFATPSRFRVCFPEVNLPPRQWQTAPRRIGTENYLARRFAQAAAQESRSVGTGNGGQLTIHGPGQEVLPRTCSMINDDGGWELRFRGGLPARGRRVMGDAAATMLCRRLPAALAAVGDAIAEQESLRRCADVNEDAEVLRAEVVARGLVGFVANGSLLPRMSGIDQRPLHRAAAIEFLSPESLETRFDLPNAGTVRGMAVPQGVTLIVGGGYHGKSTLLQALERGVYNHCPGDGRERVVTDTRAVKIRAEEGRSLQQVDISAFINQLPGDRDTTCFTTQNASGSTSQAAAIVEALEAGAKVLLVDEDTSATNFMIRDARMQELIAKNKEPITPFIDRVEQLSRDLAVSSVIVVGGSGDYFDVADRVIAMDEYLPRDVTSAAKRIAAQSPSRRRREATETFPKPAGRSAPFPHRAGRAPRIKTRGLRRISIDRGELDLSAVAQLVDLGQTRAIADAIAYCLAECDVTLPIAALLDQLEHHLSQQGLDGLSPQPCGDYAQFRRFEMAAALNRIRP